MLLIEPLKRKPGSEPHIEIVLGKLAGNFATWVYNKETKGYVHGYYFGNNQEEAEKSFQERD